MPRTCPAFAHAIAHSLCEGPLAPFTIQHAGSTTSPTIERAPTFAPGATASFFAAFAVADFAVPDFAAPGFAGVAGLAVVVVTVPFAGSGFGAGVDGAGFAGATCGVPVAGPDCANAADRDQSENTASASEAMALRVVMLVLHAGVQGGGYESIFLSAGA